MCCCMRVRGGRGDTASHTARLLTDQGKSSDRAAPFTRSPAPHRTAPHRSAPHRTAPHRTTPPRTAPHRTAPHRTAPHRHRWTPLLPLGPLAWLLPLPLPSCMT